jgi:hypothetical protein
LVGAVSTGALTSATKVLRFARYELERRQEVKDSRLQASVVKLTELFLTTPFSAHCDDLKLSSIALILLSKVKKLNNTRK